MAKQQQFSQIKPALINTECYIRIKNAILTGYFAWGERLDVGQIANEFGISKFPVIKALDKLAIEQLVTILPNKGTFVVSPLINDIEEIMEIRMMFELTAFDLACQKNLPALISTIDALQKNTSGDFKTFSTLQKRGEFLQYDREFHRCFFICSANRRLLGFHDVVHSQVELLRVKIFSAENTKIALAAHVEIAQLLQQKKISPAKEALKNHIGQVRHDILTSYKENGQNAGS